MGFGTKMSGNPTYLALRGHHSCGETLASPRKKLDHGRISIGVPTGTAAQIWSISGFVTAMHPSVQSTQR